MITHAVITGGSSGIGLSLAKKLAARDALVTIIARTKGTLERAAEAVASVHPRGAKGVAILSADVADRSAACAAIDVAIARNGAPDLLVTSAGIAVPGRFLEVPDEVFETTMQVNYFGTLWCVRRALPAMRKAGRGRIVMVSSGAGLIGLYGYTPYAPTKFALRGLAESLRQEVKPDGIAVSIVYPPDTETPQLEAELRTKPEETKRMTGTARLWQADAVADVIIRGIDKDRIDICPGFELASLNVLGGVVMPLLRRHADRIVRKVAREQPLKPRPAERRSA